MPRSRLFRTRTPADFPACFVRGVIAALLLIALGCVPGCTRNEYELEMKPDGAKLDRKLAAHRTGGGQEENEEGYGEFPVDELKQIAAAYGAEVPEKLARKHTFEGQFESSLPTDLGGHGTYLHWPTSFGSSFAYVERVRGRSDWVADLEQRREAVNRLVDAIIVWLEHELQDSPRWPRYRVFLEGPFRHDVHNLALHAWGYSLAAHRSPDQAQQIYGELAVRGAQYLLEEGYYEPDELPNYVRAFTALNQERVVSALGLLRELLTGRIAILADIPEAERAEARQADWEFLESVETLKQSVTAALRPTDGYKQYVQQKAGEGDLSTRPVDYLGDLVLRAFGPDFQPAPDRLVARLRLDSAPLFTNGTYDAEMDRLVWERSLQSRDHPYPGFSTLMYAFWVEPDERFQRRHFGRVVLEGAELYQYTVWHAALTDEERQVWDSFVTNLKPEDDLASKLEAFRFPGEKPDQSNWADPTLNAIRNRLDD